ncbi:hypothetical protein [Risungbinella massiliensis]|uniref:hypothetical protein n=1 Tax=Risungbinella massiliensis TaxID=1329796 RepID=UPI0005CC5B8B|nr:hypothetical protein [Risungbinella massiliensis]
MSYPYPYFPPVSPLQLANQPTHTAGPYQVPYPGPYSFLYPWRPMPSFYPPAPPIAYDMENEVFSQTQEEIDYQKQWNPPESPQAPWIEAYHQEFGLSESEETEVD